MIGRIFTVGGFTLLSRITGFVRDIVLAAILAVVPPLVAGGGWETWIYRSLVLLVVSFLYQRSLAARRSAHEDSR